MRSVRVIASAVALVGVVAAAQPAAGGQRFVEDVYVRAANRGDYAAVCRLYSHRYLKISQAACRALYRSGETLYGPYDYRIVRRRVLPSGHRHVDLRLHRRASFVEFAHEPAGWRIVAGGF
jgi:hypothetical protein